MGTLKQWYIDNLEGKRMVGVNSGRIWECQPVSGWKGSDNEGRQLLYKIIRDNTKFPARPGSIVPGDISAIRTSLDRGTIEIEEPVKDLMEAWQ